MLAERDNTPATRYVGLASLLWDRFATPALDDQWRTTIPEGFAPVIEDGILDVQARTGGDFETSAMESRDAWGPGLVFEARARWVPGSTFLDLVLQHRRSTAYADTLRDNGAVSSKD